ncbi:LamG domain-containing protein [Candidatus Nomurabacteria bacterium]|nr:LamG domain-containing protein [Candidatus Kaiserbacteria bacterium]MCB9810128.1 LamG domain-containing protein [Candidatus Nomurabacteria bacterium]MCB9818526.1 LamG domain-containing protein [Candidatus Nomurabacteria bacterium]
MDENQTPEPFVGAFFKVVLGLVVLGIVVTQTPLGGLIGSASAGVYQSTVGLLRTNTGGLTLDDGLVGHWTFDGNYMDLSSSTAEILDRSSNGNSGDWKNHSTTTVVGVSGQAINFDGVDDYLEIADNDIYSFTDGGGNDQPFSITTWINTSDTSFGIAEKVPGATGGEWRYTVNSGYIQLTLYTDASNITTKYSSLVSELNDGWVFLSVVYDGSEVYTGITHYVNGQVRNGTASAFGSYTGMTNTSNSIIVADDATSGKLDGSIDDLRIYNRALSADEIQKLYQLGVGNKIATTITNDSLEQDLLAHWTFDGSDLELSSTTAQVRDVSGNFNHLASGGVITASDFDIGKIGQAIKMDGSTDYLTSISTSFDSPSALSVSAWIKPDSANTFHVVDKGTGSVSPANGFIFYIHSSGWITFRVGYDGGQDLIAYTSSGVVDVGEWQHIMATWDGTSDASKVKIYKNGILQPNSVETSGTGSLETMSSQFIVGRSSTGANDFDGQMDDIRIYEREFTPEEVQRLYQMGGGVKIADTATSSGSLASGLVGHWTFDGPDMDLFNSSAEVLDISGNDNHGNWLNHATTTTIGKIGQAIEFDGVDDYVYKSSNSSLDIEGGEYTFSAWAYMTKDTGADQHVLVQNPSSGNGVELKYDYGNDSWQFNFRDGSATWKYGIFTQDNVELNRWYHIVGVRDSVGAKVYVDGVLGATAESATGNNTFSNDTSIGRSNYTAARGYFNGKIDDARIYNRALSADEVVQLYSQGR